MNLAIDVGNTHVKLAIFNNNKIIDHLTTTKLSVDYLKNIQCNYPSIKNIGFSNTGAPINGLDIFCQESKIKLIKIDATCQLPISINYNTPATLGSDRIALCVGAYINYPGATLVIDLGTCLTYDLLIRDQHVGGQISPGFNMRLLSLTHYTENLPKLNFELTSDIIGQTTKDSILLGVYEGVLFELEGIIQKYKSRYSNIKVVLTGGDVDFVKKRIKNINFINPYLLMEGLNYIIASNE
tara:strand:- start:724 stop:1443 length:720 start_codon:yes stop_codon:yes gene_type:complete